MKKVAYLILIFCFCLSEAKVILPYIEYVVNYEYISKELCVYINDPSTMCEGSCYLDQQIFEVQQSKDQKNRELPKEIEQRTLSMVELDYPEFNILNDQYSIHQYYFEFVSKESTSSPPTPPPQC